MCYIAFQAFRPLPQVPLFVGDLDKYQNDSVTLEFINTQFFDEVASKQFETLPLQVVRDGNGAINVFFARSTNPDQAQLIPRQCVVEWDDSLLEFLELCGGSRWSREGKYLSGAAPRPGPISRSHAGWQIVHRAETRKGRRPPVSVN